MKKLSLAIASLLVFSAASFAQDGTKAKKAQEPVKATSATHEVKADKVPVTPTATNQPAPAKKRLIKKQVVRQGDMKAVPVTDAKAK